MDNKKSLTGLKTKTYFVSVLTGTLMAYIFILILTQLFLGYEFNKMEIIKILLLIPILFTIPTMLLTLLYFLFKGTNKIILILPHIIYVGLSLILIITDWRDGDSYLIAIILSIISLISGIFIFTKSEKIFRINK